MDYCLAGFCAVRTILLRAITSLKGLFIQSLTVEIECRTQPHSSPPKLNYGKRTFTRPNPGAWASASTGKTSRPGAHSGSARLGGLSSAKYPETVGEARSAAGVEVTQRLSFRVDAFFEGARDGKHSSLYDPFSAQTPQSASTCVPAKWCFPL